MLSINDLKKIDKKLPFVRELTKNYIGIDPVYEMIPVRPVVHYMMGGIDTNKDGSTSEGILRLQNSSISGFDSSGITLPISKKIIFSNGDLDVNTGNASDDGYYKRSRC